MRYTKSIKSLFGQINKMLRSSNFNEASLEQIATKVVKLAEALERSLLKSEYLKGYMQDDAPLGLVAETGSDAIGDSTLAQSRLKAGVFDFDKVSIAIASTASTAAAKGGQEYATASGFVDVIGSDLTFTRTKTVAGDNFVTTTTQTVAVDFKFLKDFNFNHRQSVTINTNQRAAVAEGNLAVVEFDAVAVAANTAVEVQADALAIDNLLSSTSISTGVFIG